MSFSNTIDEFLDSYAFKDKEEVYTNGSMLIPTFRVKQGIEHHARELNTVINRQAAEIERLKKKNTILSKNADTAFQDGLNENRDLFKKEVEPEIRNEAIREFAERLKKYLCLDLREGISVVTTDNINKIVKEMTRSEDE